MPENIEPILTHGKPLITAFVTFYISPIATDLAKSLPRTSGLAPLINAALSLLAGICAWWLLDGDSARLAEWLGWALMASVAAVQKVTLEDRQWGRLPR